MQNTFSVHFIVRNDRMDEDRCVPIYAKILINGSKLFITTNHKIAAKDWNAKKGLPKPSCSNLLELQSAIEALKSRIYQAYSTLMATNQSLNASSIKEAMFGKKEQIKVHMLIEIATEHNLNFQKLIGIKYSEGSYKNYKTSLKYFKEFVPRFYGKNDMPISLVNFKFCEAFYEFLTTLKDCKTNGANKQIQRLKKIVHYAINQGYLQSSSVATYSLENTPVNKIALTFDELTRLKNVQLNRPVLKQVRDVFLIQAYTGLAYADIKRLSINDLQLDNKGDYWIRMDRQKTLIAFSVPILAPALLILEDYINIASPASPLLPVLSNQKMNDNLKVIQELAGVAKNLTTHLARHTFATTITLSNGVPIETVSRMLGHTKISTTQIYAKVLDGKIAEDMNRLKLRMIEQNEEA